MAFQTPQFGITMVPTDYAIQPVPLARAVEERGFDSLFFPGGKLSKPPLDLKLPNYLIREGRFTEALEEYQRIPSLAVYDLHYFDLIEPATQAR